MKTKPQPQNPGAYHPLTTHEQNHFSTAIIEATRNAEANPTFNITPFVQNAAKAHHVPEFPLGVAVLRKILDNQRKGG